MAIRHGRSERKSTGGRYRSQRKSKKYEVGGEFTATRLADDHEVRAQDSRGNDTKKRVKQVHTANLAAGGETTETEIEAVVENPANPDYVRRDIITKGTVIETADGRARVTSRPGQDGTVNAVLLDE
jgi:small subunit ribosomal protein S8e